jgi:hypothetical protein
MESVRSLVLTNISSSVTVVGGSVLDGALEYLVAEPLTAS